MAFQERIKERGLQPEREIMAVLPILEYPNEILRKTVAKETSVDEELVRLSKDMAETMYAAPGVGLAAPQVGQLRRIIVLDCAREGDPPDLLVAVNPEILESEGEVCHSEGCLSIPGYYADVMRHAKIRARWLDVTGKEVTGTLEGLKAICFQHECEHLDGGLFIDHLSPLKRSLFRKKYKKQHQNRSGGEKGDT